LACSQSAQAGTLPNDNFQETVAFSGFSNPTVISFAPNGRVFVAEKSGLIKVFDGLGDTTATQVADLSDEVYNFWDRGLLGLAVDPQFPADPYLYVLYTRDALPGGEPQEWGSPGVLGDPCPGPPAGPGALGDGCVVSARLARLTLTGDVMSEPPTPLITDWCQQYPSHSIGDLNFGPDGALYVSGGDGAAWHLATDYGQDGNPVNPCGDPPSPPGTLLTPPTAEGGTLRSQDIRTPSSPSDPTGLNGAILRLDPDTGQGLPGNPHFGSSDANERRIVAYGQRNPFRFTLRPGTDEVWAGDVGRGTWEEINRIVDPTDATSDNLGWPCYEGVPRQDRFEDANLDLCDNLYDEGAGAVVPPYFTYHHDTSIVPGETCPFGSSSISGLDFYQSGPFPNSYDGALFFADYSRDCIWAMLPGGNGLPDPATIQVFDAGAANPVDLEVGPQGDLFYADFNGGTIRRVTYSEGNRPPTAVATATPDSGPAPLQVQLDASGSSDPDGDTPLDYAWDLDEDGQFDDSTQATLMHTFTQPGTHDPAVRVTDPDDASGTDSVSVQAGNSPPVAQIDEPTFADLWAVDETVDFSATATDAQQTLPPSAFDWEVIIDHCPSNCHEHALQEFNDVMAGSFSAPDHEYPTSLRLDLTVTDAGGLTDTDSVTIDPRTVDLTLSSVPAGLELTLNEVPTTAPFTRIVIEGSQNSVIAPTDQVLGGENYVFGSWSDGGAATHNITADQTETLVATFTSTASAAPPDTVITGGPPARVKALSRKRAGRTGKATGGKLKLTFSATEPVSGFQCRLDNRAYVPCSSPLVLKGLKRGAHKFRVRAVDDAGNVDPTPASHRFRVDKKKKRSTGT
jgi:glucose/arabinose dehydrogenase